MQSIENESTMMIKEDSNQANLGKKQQEVAFNVQVNGLHSNTFPTGLPINSEVLLKNVPFPPNYPKNIRVFYQNKFQILGNISVKDTNQLYEIVTNPEYEVKAIVCDNMEYGKKNGKGNTQKLMVTYSKKGSNKRKHDASEEHEEDKHASKKKVSYQPKFVKGVRLPSAVEKKNRIKCKETELQEGDTIFQRLNVSHVLKVCGMELIVEKTSFLCDHITKKDYENQDATYLMINPGHGFADIKWQDFVGPVVLFRKDKKDFTLHEYEKINEFFYDLIDAFPDGSQRTMISKTYFDSYMCEL